MKFEQQIPDGFEVRQKTLGECTCGAFTRWFDPTWKIHLCSTECYEAFWRQKLSAEIFTSFFYRINVFGDKMHDEDVIAFKHWKDDASKDIVIVVHDQLEYVKECIESIQTWTTNYHIYIWDNASDPETREYLENLGWRYIRSDVNKGFIEPNNYMASLGTSEYLILLNSDTKVMCGWSEYLCGMLAEQPDVIQTGCLGGLLEANGTGSYTNFGYDIDYLMGWCVCMRRKDYEKHGLFNEEMRFAYFEDADLSLRLKSSGHKIYAFYNPLVHHYGNKTLANVDIDLMETIGYNHAILKEHWKEYLDTGRVKAPRKPRIWGSPGVSRKNPQV